MAPKGRTFLFLLIVACAALAKPPDGMPENKRNFKVIAKKLMRNCLKKGYPPPEWTQLNTIFNNSDFPMADRDSEQSNTLLSTFFKVLHEVCPDKENKGPQVNKTKNKMWDFRDLLTMIKLMRNSSAATACYMQAFVAPLSLAALISQSHNNMTSDDYDMLLWAAKPALENMPFKGSNLPANVGTRQKLKKMMEMLKEVYPTMSKHQRTQVVEWEKEQISQTYFNCTMRPPSASKSMSMEHCKPLLGWLNSEVLEEMGPYISHLTPNDIDSSSKQQLCDFFRSAKFKFTKRMTTNMNPSLSKKFLQKFQECFTGEEFAENVDKLGTLVCHYSAPPDLTPDLSRKLLSELNNYSSCSNPRIKQLKKRLVKSVMSNTSDFEGLSMLGKSVALLSHRQLSKIPANNLLEILKNLGPSVTWTEFQLRTLVKKLLGDKCTKVSTKQLMALQSAADGVPICVLKQVKEILNDPEGLRNISKRMRKGKLMAILQGPLGDVDPLQLVKKLPEPLLHLFSLNKLEKAKITSVDQVVDKTWDRKQAAFLAKKLYNAGKLVFRGLRSVLQGVTCEMIEKVADGDTKDMAQAITETPQWLSIVQARCAARKLFKTLEKERADYFKTITEKEMKDIPTCLLLHLGPSLVKDLPDSVCPALLDNMEEADLSLLAPRSVSRLALTERALLCLAKGTDLSGLTEEDVSRLGPLLCELQPSQLRLMAPDVLNSSLLAMASCQHIPQRHRADLLLLVKQTFGAPSDWSAENMEALGPLLLWDDNAISALPNKPWMVDILYFLRSGLHNISDALRKKYFDLITNTSDAARKKRTADSNDNTTKPTVEKIEELGIDNVYWAAAQLDQMSNDMFLNTVETLGAVSDYRTDQLAVLRRKAVETFHPVPQMTDGDVMQMGCITRGFSSAELEKLPFSLDTLEKIAKCGWTESQMESVWRGFAKYNNLTAQQLQSADMVALNQFICGLNSSELGQLNINAFKDAVGSMDDVKLSLRVAQQLKRLAVSAFGNPNSWNEAQVSELGSIIAGLDATEMASLDPSVFSFISTSCIPLIQPHNFAALSADQLGAFGPDNIAKVTSEQRAALNDEQLEALERAETGSPDQTQTSNQSGPPSLSVEGTSAIVKPLLFLLMGFMLL